MDAYDWPLGLPGQGQGQLETGGLGALLLLVQRHGVHACAVGMVLVRMEAQHEFEGENLSFAVRAPVGFVLVVKPCGVFMSQFQRAFS